MCPDSEHGTLLNSTWEIELYSVLQELAAGHRRCNLIFV